MDKRNNAYNTSFQELKVYFDSNSGEFSNNTLLNSDISKYKTSLNDWDSANVNISGSASTGATDKKASTIHNMVFHAHLVGNILYRYAKDTNNPELANKLIISFTEVLHLKQADCMAYCQFVFETATNNLSLMSNYPLTQSDLGDLGTAITDFQNSSDTQIKANKTRIDANKNINIVRAKILDILNDIDNLMPQQCKNNPALLEQYNQARKLPAMHVHHKKTNNNDNSAPKA